MIDRLEILRGQRARLHTIDSGNVTGTLGEITYTDGGIPIVVEIREPEDIPSPFVLIPWTSVSAIEPAQRHNLDDLERRLDDPLDEHPDSVIEWADRHEDERPDR